MKKRVYTEEEEGISIAKRRERRDT